MKRSSCSRLVSAFALAIATAACGSSGSSPRAPQQAAANPAPAASAPAPASAPSPAPSPAQPSPGSAFVGSIGAIAQPATPPAAPPASGSTPPASGSTPPAAPPASGGAPAPGAPAPGAPAATGPELVGTVPFAFDTSFTGQLFFLGRRMQPGSVIEVAYQGAPVAYLPATFDSSEIISSPVFFAAAGDYGFTLVDLSGQRSNTLTMTIDDPAGSALTPDKPELFFTFPTAIPQGFAGTIYLMGEDFAPGASLRVRSQGAEVYLPLGFVNSQTLSWTVAAPLAGTLELSIINPDLQASDPIQIAIDPAQPGATGLPQPQVSSVPGSVSAPFLGTIHIFGQDFLPGATLEITDSNTGLQIFQPLIFAGTNELWWPLAYPLQGQYELRILNPDNQASLPFSFEVQ